MSMIESRTLHFDLSSYPQDVEYTLLADGHEHKVNSYRNHPEKLAEHATAWRDAGATHLSVNTMGVGLPTVDDHLRVLDTAAQVLKPLAE